MKVVHLSNTDSGGAIELHAAMLEYGIQSSMIVAKHDLGYASNIVEISRFHRRLSTLSNLLSKQILGPLNRQRGIFSLPILSGQISNHKLIKSADVIYLHFVAHSSFISLSELTRLIKLGKPVVFVTRDMWPITGGCHTFLDCEKYKNTCHKCPCLVNGRRFFDIAKFQQSKKNKLFDQSENVSFVAISSWNAEVLKQSKNLRHKPITTIHNCIDTISFKPLDKSNTRRDLNLPLDKVLLGFGARSIKNPLKGFHYLQQTFRVLRSVFHLEFDLVTFGRTDNYQLSIEGVEQYDLGTITKRSTLVSFYNSIDVFLNPTLFENFGNTAAESISCGTPVVGFKTGGLNDIIQHKVTGYLAAEGDVEDLAQGVIEVVNKVKNVSITNVLHENASTKFSRARIIKEHLLLMEDALFEWGTKHSKLDE